MKNYKYIWLLILTVGFLSSCDDDEDDFLPKEVVLPELTTGSADFSNYVAIGASFTAGFTDGGLFSASQGNSFPNILSKQFNKIGGGDFPQPLMNDNSGGILVGGNQATDYRLVFDSDAGGPVRLDDFFLSRGVPKESLPPVTTEAGMNIGSNFNNFGIPGAKSFHLVTPGYAAFNPFYARIASAPSSTVLADALAQNPTFFTLSDVGGNDILGYATSGAESNTSSESYNPLTPIGNFNDALNTLVDNLTSGDAKGVITNVPYVEDLPFFRTVPYNPIPLDEDTANALNQGYATYNAGLQQAFAALNGTGLFSSEELAKRTIEFVQGQNAMIIIDENLTDLGAINPAFAAIPKYRQATKDDLFVLPLSSLIPQGYGTQIPLEDKWCLTPEEQQEIKDMTDLYNVSVESIAQNNEKIALVNLNSILTELASMGINFDGFNLKSDLVTGGAISLDGIHLTARGYAYLANKFLEEIDKAFGSNFIASGNIAKAADFPTNYSPELPDPEEPTN